MTQKPKASVWPRLFNGSGYLLVATEWLVLGLLYVPSLLESEAMQKLFPAGNEVKFTPAETSNAVEPSAGLILLATILGLLFLGFVGYTIFRKYIPAVVNNSEKVIEKSTEQIVHVREKQKPHLTKRKKRMLTEQVSFWLKMTAAILPLAILLIFSRHDDSLATVLARFTTALAALLAVGCLSVSRRL
jgi:uncharacterized membrane protein